MRRRVVVTGMGAVTPVGHTVRETWKALLEGRSGIEPITLFPADTFPTQIAGEVKNFDTASWIRQGNGFRYLGRNSLFALQAASEAVADSGIRPDSVEASRYGIYFGAGDGGFNFPELGSILVESVNGHESSVDGNLYFEKSVERMNPQAVLEQEPYQVLNHLTSHFGTRGIVSNCLTACAASSQAIGEATEIIRRGEADIMISGGSHSMIHPMGLAGFNLLTALSTNNARPGKASRPFDKNRDGFVLSEGAGVLVLEDLGHALKRRAPIYAEIAGYGVTADAFRLTDPHPNGRGAIQAMRLCLADAALDPASIDYINAHGTSTQLNDQIETASVKEIFGDRAYKIPMSSIKSMLGHMIAAAGVVEVIASTLTIRESAIPPTINYETRDEACDLDYVPNQTRAHRVKTVLSNSFGFGGQNVSLIVKEFKG